MKKTVAIDSLKEDFAQIGIKLTEDTAEITKSKEGEASEAEKLAAEARRKELGEAKIIRLKRGSKARKLKRERKIKYRKGKAKLKAQAKRYRRTSGAKRSSLKRKKFMKRLGTKKVMALHKQGKRIMIAASVDEATIDQAFEAMEKMEQVLVLIEGKIDPLFENKDTLVLEHVEYIQETADEIRESLDELEESINNDEFQSEEDLELVVYEAAEDLYDLLDAYADVSELVEDEEEEADEEVEKTEEEKKAEKEAAEAAVKKKKEEEEAAVTK